MTRRKKVMIFGVFDGIHDGHKEFLKQAKKLGDYLIAVVARDHVVEHLKGELPKINLAERFQHLRETDNVDAVIVGDSELRKWDVLDIHRPQIVALGYDQEAIREELENYFKDKDWQPTIKMMKAHEGGKFHTGLLNKFKKNKKAS